MISFAVYTAAETPMLFNWPDGAQPPKLPLPWRISVLLAHACQSPPLKPHGSAVFAGLTFAAVSNSFA